MQRRRSDQRTRLQLMLEEARRLGAQGKTAPEIVAALRELKKI